MDNIQENQKKQTKQKSDIDKAFEQKINLIKPPSLDPNPDLKAIKKVEMPTVDTILTDSITKFVPLNQLNEISYLMYLGVCGLTQPYEKPDANEKDDDEEVSEDIGEDHPEFILLYQFVEYMKKTTSDVNEYLINESLINDSLTSMQTELDKLKTYTQKVTDAKVRLDKIINLDKDKDKDSKCLISFAWKYSAQTEFKQMINVGLGKSNTKPDYTNKMKAGDNLQIENLKEPMSITKRLIIFVCILTSLACLMGLYHNITNIYNNLNGTFQGTDENLRKELFGSDSFDIILFMKLMGQMLSNTFQTTLKDLQESGIKQRLLQLSTNINNNLIQSATLKTDPNNLWDFGIINSVVDVLSGTLQSRMVETAGIEQEYMLSALQNEITATVKREFVEKRYLLTNTFETIIYCINGLTVSTVIALNQYNPQLVSAESVKIVSAASASVMASNSLLARISGLTSGSAVLSKAIWTLAVGIGNKQSQLTEGMSPLEIEAEIPNQLYLRGTDNGKIMVVDKDNKELGVLDILGVLNKGMPNKGMPIEDARGGRRRRKMNKNKKREKTIKRVRMIKYSNNTSKRKRSKQNRSKKFVVSKSIQKSTKSKKSKKSTK